MQNTNKTNIFSGWKYVTRDAKAQGKKVNLGVKKVFLFLWCTDHTLSLSELFMKIIFTITANFFHYDLFKCNYRYRFDFLLRLCITFKQGKSNILFVYVDFLMKIFLECLDTLYERLHYC